MKHKKKDSGPPGDELEAKIRSIVREEMGGWPASPEEQEAIAQGQAQAEPPAKPKEERLTPRQAAKLLGVCGGTLAKYRRAGRLTSYREKGRVYLLKHEVEAANIKPWGRAAAAPPANG